MKATINDLLMEKWLRQRESGELAWSTKLGKQLPLKNLSDEQLEEAIQGLEEEEEDEAFDDRINQLVINEVLSQTDYLDYDYDYELEDLKHINFNDLL